MLSRSYFPSLCADSLAFYFKEKIETALQKITKIPFLPASQQTLSPLALQPLLSLRGSITLSGIFVSILFPCSTNIFKFFHNFKSPISLHPFTSSKDLSLWTCFLFLSSAREQQWHTGCFIAGTLSILSWRDLSGMLLGIRVDAVMDWDFGECWMSESILHLQLSKTQTATSYSTFHLDKHWQYRSIYYISSDLNHHQFYIIKKKCQQLDYDVIHHNNQQIKTC